MARQKKSTQKDEETLKHYTPMEEKDLPEEVRKALGQSGPGPKPTYVKPEISVSKELGKRKSAVIPKPKPAKSASPPGKKK